MTATAGLHDLVCWRMRALGLWQPLPGTADASSKGEDRIAAVAHGLLALQGQDWNASRWALGLRAAGTTEGDVIAAFDDGLLVRTWPMRGTIHVVPAGDIAWMQAATGKKVLAGAAKRRAYLGLDDETLTRMVDIAVELLEGGRSASRDELTAAWSAAGIGDSEKGVGPWRYHVIWWLSQNGIAVPGPVGAGGARVEDAATAIETAANGTGVVPEPRLVLAEEWIESPRSLEGDEALAELAARFALGRGPVQAKDLAWWTGLGVREARRGIEAAVSAERLAAVEVEGVKHWADPRLLDEQAPSAEDDHLLLPGFDEHLLGYTDRSAVLDPVHFERIVPGRNGMFRATVVRGGRVVGTWLRTPRAKHVRIEIEPLPGESIDLEAVRPAAEAWGAFRGSEVELCQT